MENWSQSPFVLGAGQGNMMDHLSVHQRANTERHLHSGSYLLCPLSIWTCTFGLSEKTGTAEETHPEKTCWDCREGIGYRNHRWRFFLLRGDTVNHWAAQFKTQGNQSTTLLLSLCFFPSAHWVNWHFPRWDFWSQICWTEETPTLIYCCDLCSSPGTLITHKVQRGLWITTTITSKAQHIQ